MRDVDLSVGKETLAGSKHRGGKKGGLATSPLFKEGFYGRDYINGKKECPHGRTNTRYERDRKHKQTTRNYGEKQMSTKEISTNVQDTFRGIQRVFKVSVGVIEAFAWVGLLAIGYTLIFAALKDKITLSTPSFFGVTFSTAVITLRLAFEGAKYFRDTGRTYER